MGDLWNRFHFSGAKVAEIIENNKLFAGKIAKRCIFSCHWDRHLTSLIREMKESIDFIRHTIVLIINKCIKNASRIF